MYCSLTHTCADGGLLFIRRVSRINSLHMHFFISWLHWVMNVKIETILPFPCKAKVLSMFLLLFLCLPAHASTLAERKQAIDTFFEAPCAKYDVPKPLALAIARQESGWQPWILNISGKDIHPRTREEAMRYASWAMQAGRSFDVGLMQVNSYWIRKYGWPLHLVLEPENNVKIGIWILAQEIRKHGLNWKAVAYYHTPLHKNPERGRRYAHAVVAHLKNIMGEK